MAEPILSVRGLCTWFHQDEGIVRALWLSREELEARKTQMRSPVVLRVIDDYLRGIHYPLELISTLD